MHWENLAYRSCDGFRDLSKEHSRDICIVKLNDDLAATTEFFLICHMEQVKKEDCYWMEENFYDRFY